MAAARAEFRLASLRGLNGNARGTSGAWRDGRVAGRAAEARAGDRLGADVNRTSRSTLRNAPRSRARRSPGWARARVRLAFPNVERLEARFLLSATDLNRSAVIPLSVFPVEVSHGTAIDPGSPFVKEIEATSGASTVVNVGQAGQVVLTGTLPTKGQGPSYEVQVGAGLSTLAITFGWQDTGHHAAAEIAVFDASGRPLVQMPIGEGVTIALVGLEAHAGSSVRVQLQPGSRSAGLDAAGGNYRIAFSSPADTSDSLFDIGLSTGQQNASDQSGPFVGALGGSAGSTQGLVIGVPPPGGSSQGASTPVIPGAPPAPPSAANPASGSGTLLSLSAPLPTSAPRPLGGLLGTSSPVPLIAGRTKASGSLGVPSVSATAQADLVLGQAAVLGGSASHVAPGLGLIPAVVADRLFADAEALASTAPGQPWNADLGSDLLSPFRPSVRLIKAGAERERLSSELRVAEPWIPPPLEFPDQSASARSSRGAFLPSAAELATGDPSRARSPALAASTARGGAPRPWRLSLAMGVNGALMLAVGLFGPDLALAFRRVLRTPVARSRVRRSRASRWLFVRVESEWLA